MSEFSYELGDKVKRINGSNNNVNEGETGIVDRIDMSSTRIINDKDGKKSEHNNENLVLVTKAKKLKKTMSLKTIVSGLFIKEPEKSRQKAGITDSSNELTEEGKDIYLNYLLSKDKDFDTEIVAKVVAEMDKSSK